MPSHPLKPLKPLSCGVLVLDPRGALLLCHVTGQHHWDLPKGRLDPGETPLQAALRETCEETGLALHPQALMDLGRFVYTAKKDLHLFATSQPQIDTGELHCTSYYTDAATGRLLPEMDGYGWFTFDRVAGLCVPKMAAVLTERIDLRRLLERLCEPPPVAAASVR